MKKNMEVGAAWHQLLSLKEWETKWKHLALVKFDGRKTPPLAAIKKWRKKL